MNKDEITMDKLMVLMIGIQGSGKSEFCKRFMGDYEYISLDELNTRNKEGIKIHECLANDISFVIDNTNPTIDDRRRYIELVKPHGYRVVAYFMESKLAQCIARNNLREGKKRLPAKAIAATSNKLQMPSYAEGFDELYFVANDGMNMTISEWRE